MTKIPPQLDPDEREKWLAKIKQANRHNIFCHCHKCGKEWIGSSFSAICQCGSTKVERISCWQFPDD